MPKEENKVISKCKKCPKCCNNASFTRKEYDLVVNKYGHPDPSKVIDLGLDYVVLHGQCAFLGKSWCNIYPDRPKICRDYGDIIPCRY